MKLVHYSKETTDAKIVTFEIGKLYLTETQDYHSRCPQYYLLLCFKEVACKRIMDLQMTEEPELFFYIVDRGEYSAYACKQKGCTNCLVSPKRIVHYSDKIYEL